MDDALLTATALLAIATVLLLVAGRRPLPYGARLVALTPALIAATAGLPLAAPLTCLVIALLTLTLPRNWYAVGAWLFAGFSVAFGLYVVYLARSVVLLGSDPLSVLLGVALLLLEVGAMVLLLSSAFEMIDALCAPPIEPKAPPDPLRWPVACLQVPTYNEPPDLVIETVRSLVALDYPALRVQLIDNNTGDEALWRPLEAECARLRADGYAVEFVHLPQWPGYKGGALNWGREHLDPDVEIVGVVDADYVVEADWLRATMPHFSDPLVAFVQTPQDYRAWEGSGFYRACYVGFAYFFKVGMVSRARRNAIIFAGTMGLIRRSVLDEVGGWDEEIITEDAEISLRVLAKGYRSVYITRPFGRGIMPLSYEGLRKQRFRWAFGGIQILRRHWRTLLGRGSGLSLAQRYDHLMGGLWWFNDALMFGFTLFVAAAAVGAISGRPFIVQRLTGIGIVLPIVFIVLNLVRYVWGLQVSTGARPPLAVAALRVNLSLSWVVALACARALTQERGVFLRTPKFAGAAAIRELRLVWVEAAIALAATVTLVGLIVTAGFSTVGIVLAVLVAWPVVIYGSAVSFALGDPARAPLGEALREKARLEIAPRVGRVAKSRPARAGAAVAGLASLLLVVALAAERDRPAIADLPFREPVAGPGFAARPAATPSGEPTPSAGPSESLAPGTSGAPTGPRSTEPPVAGTTSSPGGGAGSGPTSRPTSTPGPTPTAAPQPTPAPTTHPTPPVPVPTPEPTTLPSPHPRPTPSAPPHPSPPAP
jgi:cellulose synthase/poly-beta-1,6-N-acetylglucosamine synthase-like glycosyltransferase